MLIIYNLVFINKMSSWPHRRCNQSHSVPVPR